MSNICPPVLDFKRYCVKFTDFSCEQIEELVSYYSQFNEYLCQIIVDTTTTHVSKLSYDSLWVNSVCQALNIIIPTTTTIPIISYTSRFNKYICQHILYIFYNTNINEFVCQYKVPHNSFISIFRTWICQYLEIPTTEETTIEETTIEETTTEVTTESTITTTEPTSTETTIGTTLSTTIDEYDNIYLYNGYTILDERNISNSNAHVPTNNEINTLITFLGDIGIAGGKLKEIGTENWITDSGSTNDFGFTAKPGGYRDNSGECYYKGYTTWFWISTLYYGIPTYIFLNDYSNSLNKGHNYSINSGFSIRLIVDTPIEILDNHAIYVGNDSRRYNCVLIDSQWWMAEDLKETQYRDHSIIPIIEDNTVWHDLTSGARSRYIDTITTIEETTTTTTIITTTVEEQSLKLTLINITYADLLISGSSSNVSDWNTFFDLPTNGTPFTSVNVIDNVVNLYGGSNIILKDNLFDDVGGYGINIRGFEDNAGCIIIAGNNCFGSRNYSGCIYLNTVTLPNLTITGEWCFYNCGSLISLDFPNLTTIGNNCFYDCANLILINIPLCTNLGITVEFNGVFNGIVENTITLTVPSALMTCNEGQPDGDIQYLQANNTVTIIEI